MTRTSRRVAALGLLLALGAGGGAAGAPATAAAAATRATGPVRLTATFDRTARLGAATALDVTLRLDPKRLTLAPLTEVQLAYPQELGLVSSGLGLATCTRPASDFAQVLVEGPLLGGCPPNAVMGYGEARAIVRLAQSSQAIDESATVTLLSGPISQGRLGLVIYVEGQQPFGAQLAFAGDVSDAAPPYGGMLAVHMPVISSLEDLATVSLTELRIVIGSHAIRYYRHQHGRLVAYRPGGIELPSRCPRGGFRFRAEVRFADGSSRSTRAVTRCPRAVAAPAGGR